MGQYSDLTDAELAAEIAEIRAAVKNAVMGGEVEVISGEGRTMKTRLLDLREAKAMLADLVREQSDPARTGVPRSGRALGVRIDAR